MTDQAPADTRHVLQARQLRFGYRQDTQVLRGVDLSVRPGTLTMILGPNGSGKTTLLRCLLGAIEPAGGEVLLDGRQLARHSPRELARLLAYVPQFPQAAFAYSVQEIVLLGRFAHSGVLGLAGKHDLAVVRQAMIMTQTLDLAGRTLEELSGGEAQRVMIARALAQQPSVMLLDEPTSHLDIRSQLVIHQMMVRLAHEWEMAVVCVSHDINMAARFADELVLMRSGEVAAQGAPADVVTRDTIQRVYDVTVELLSVPGQQVPLVAVKP